MICCEKKVKEMTGIAYNDGPGFGLFCEICGNKSAGRTKEDAEKAFTPTAKPKKQETKKPMQSRQVATISPQSVTAHFNNKQSEMALMVSPVLEGNMTAMQRLWTNNTERYPLALKGKAWESVWASEEGQESIKHEIEEALMTPCELGVTGDLVPYGKVCKLIPSVEALEFALTFGDNAPFEWIKIEPQYDGDQVESGRKEGNFFVDFNEMGDSRIDVVAVYVYGLHKATGKVIGEKYDAERLLQKAAEHSPPYENYLKMVRAYEFAKSEGRVKTDPNGREYFSYFTIKDVDNDKFFQKSVDNFYAQESAGKLKKDSKGEYAVEILPKKDGGTWEKKLYRSELEGGKEEKTIFMDELKNPYAGPDKPEMLRKAAGKSFLAVYKKTRNTSAAMQEIKTHNQAVKQTMDRADAQFETVEGAIED